jgi:hypothetical protein
VASVKDAQKLVTHVESALSDLKDALRNNNGDVDFTRMAGLADEIGERADAVAETFSSLDDVLMDRIDELTGSQRRSSGNARGQSKKRAKAAS